MTQLLSLPEKLRSCYSGAVYDVLRSRGQLEQILPQYIRPLNPNHRLAGPVFTIEGKRDDSLSAHESLLRWCELLSKVPTNTVAVCQPNDHTLAYMGELSVETLPHKKVLGYVVDGGCRDSKFIETLGFPVFCKHYTPVDVVAKWAPTSFGEPILIGEVTVFSGDYVLADRDGVVVIPGAIVSEVVQETEEILRKEDLVRKSILQGVNPVQAYLQYGKF